MTQEELIKFLKENLKIKVTTESWCLTYQDKVEVLIDKIKEQLKNM